MSAVSWAFPSGDPIIALCDAWVAAFNEWDAEGAKDGGGNFDTPRHKELDAIKAALQGQIEATPISTDAGCAAFWRYVWADNYLRDDTAEYPDVRRWQLQKARV